MARVKKKQTRLHFAVFSSLYFFGRCCKQCNVISSFFFTYYKHYDLLPILNVCDSSSKSTCKTCITCIFLCYVVMVSVCRNDKLVVSPWLATRNRIALNLVLWPKGCIVSIVFPIETLYVFMGLLLPYNNKLCKGDFFFQASTKFPLFSRNKRK